MNSSQQCVGHCRDGTTCSHVTGQCDRGCDAGWTGYYFSPIYTHTKPGLQRRLIKGQANLTLCSFVYHIRIETYIYRLWGRDLRI